MSSILEPLGQQFTNILILALYLDNLWAYSKSGQLKTFLAWSNIYVGLGANSSSRASLSGNQK